jgi:TonB family protein
MMLLSMLIAAAAPAAVIPPSSKWSVVADTLCTVSRDYDGDGVERSVALRVKPLYPGLELLLVTPPAPPTSPASGKASIAIGDAAPLDGAFGSYTTARRDHRVASIRLAPYLLPTLAASTTLTITLAGEPPVTVSMKDIATALARLRACEEMQSRKLGVDPGEAARIASPAKRDGSVPLLTPDDYPPAAIRAEAQGRVYGLWTIDREGKATDCLIVDSTGNPDLDDATCRVMMRAHFTPAIGKDGAPMASHQGIAIRWVIPSG